MNKKLISIIAVLVVAVVGVTGYLVFRSPDTVSDESSVIVRRDPDTGLSIYNNLDYGFSVAYSISDWQGPLEKLAQDPDADFADPFINATFFNAPTSEVAVIIGKPGDTESLNDFAAPLDSAYKVVTVGGLPALRYEYVSPINEAGTAYAKTVMFVIKGLKKGSVTIAYQKITGTEKEAKAADVSKADAFASHITFSEN